MIILYILGGAVALWFSFCGLIWIHYFMVGHKSDHSGDGGLAVISLPILPFVLLWSKFIGGLTWIGTKFEKLFNWLGF